MVQKVFIRNFGCQMNKLDSELVHAALREAGFGFVDSADIADIVVLNTCSIRHRAEEKVFSQLGNYKRMKQDGHGLIVAVIGCMAQRISDELLSHPAVDIVCGPTQISQIVDLIRQAIADNADKKKAVTEKIRGAIDLEQNLALDDFELAYDRAFGKTAGHAFVRVMRGCNNFCSYCIVPYVRGPETSRSPEVIMEQIKRLAGDGVKVVTLLGQTVNSYEYSAGDRTYCLADLLEMISRIDGIEWIKFVTSYPSDTYFDQICHAMANLDKVCNYLHMPAQSGSDRILKAMNRHYTCQQYLDLLDKARAIVGDIDIAGDFIVGFSGETDQDFQQTIELVKKAKYRNCFVFKYSPRPATVSSNRMIDDVSEQIKQQRNVELLSVGELVSEKIAQNFVGKKVKVFVEGLSKKPHLNNTAGDTPQLVGRTSGDWIVVFNGQVSLAGEFVEVEIVKASPLTLFGQIKA